eukprot:TRINITY_DN37_c0_g1_i10.p1 TRINITY_DN37_c0_g1~~TRINITY_DN37_c0_g1_i10.p1  ORF type:complete len:153 (-),score=79.66 TRINITY_DN37_c0_g1_i10:179-571(-)
MLRRVVSAVPKRSFMTVARPLLASAEPAAAQPGVAGVVPSNVEQATGLEKLDMQTNNTWWESKPTKGAANSAENPYVLFTRFEERIVGCEEGSTGHVWYKLKVGEAASQCPGCQSWVVLKKFPDAEGHKH